MQANIITIDWIDRLTMEREADEFFRYHVKKQLMQLVLEMYPHATHAERLSIACAVDAKYPTPILRAIALDTN